VAPRGRQAAAAARVGPRRGRGAGRQVPAATGATGAKLATGATRPVEPRRGVDAAAAAGCRRVQSPTGARLARAVDWTRAVMYWTRVDGSHLARAVDWTRAVMYWTRVDGSHLAAETSSRGTRRRRF